MCIVFIFPPISSLSLVLFFCFLAFLFVFYTHEMFHFEYYYYYTIFIILSHFFSSFLFLLSCCCCTC